MTIIRDKLFNAISVPATTGVLFTCPASTKLFFSGFTLHNTGTVPELVRLYSVPNNAGAAGTATAVPHRFLAITLAAGETFVYEAPPDGIVLNAVNDTIQGETTLANKVNIFPHGTKDVTP